jgi:preprotein translocase subunit SecG
VARAGHIQGFFERIMITVVIVIHLMVVMALIAVVLLQKSEGGGLGIGSAGGFLTNRGTANVLTRTTAYLALTFFATSLMLSWIASFDRKPTSILNTGAPPGQSQPAAPGNNAPLAPGGGGLLKELQGKERPQQPAPPPGGPQVPQSQ